MGSFRAMKRVLALLPLLMCAGCLGSNPPMAANLDALALAKPAPQEAPAARKDSGPSVRLPPEAAEVAGVSVSRHANGFSERVRLATDARKPDSRIDLAVGAGADATAASDDEIRAELVREFPGVPMQIAPAGAYQNAYGEYGLAIGRSGDALRCIYVWQYIEDARVSFANGDRIAPWKGGAAPASLRVKLCRADMTIDELASDASRLEIALRDDPGPGAPVHAAKSERPHVASRRARRREPRPVYASGPVAPAEEPRYPTTINTPGATLPVTAAAPEGQRFLASPASAPQTAGGPILGAVQTQGFAASNLPPQAFAGPTNPLPH
jgi:Cellulose biosynthesis protein BcsN